LCFVFQMFHGTLIRAVVRARRNPKKSLKQLKHETPTFGDRRKSEGHAGSDGGAAHTGLVNRFQI
jgi:hypothetical protein